MAAAEKKSSSASSSSSPPAYLMRLSTRATTGAETISSPSTTGSWSLFGIGLPTKKLTPLPACKFTGNSIRGNAGFEWDLPNREQQKLFVRTSPAGLASVVSAGVNMVRNFATGSSKEVKIDGVDVDLEQPLFATPPLLPKRGPPSGERAKLRLHGDFKRGRFYPSMTVSRRNAAIRKANKSMPEIDWSYTYRVPANSSANAHELTLEVHSPRSGWDVPDISGIINTWLPSKEKDGNDDDCGKKKKGKKMHARLGCRHTIVSDVVVGNVVSSAPPSSSSTPPAAAAAAAADTTPSQRRYELPIVRSVPLLRQASLLETSAKLHVSPFTVDAALAFPSNATAPSTLRLGAEMALSSYPDDDLPFPTFGTGKFVRRAFKRPPTLRLSYDVAKDTYGVMIRAPLDKPAKYPQNRRESAEKDCLGTVRDERELKREGVREWLVPVTVPFPKSGKGKADLTLNMSSAPKRGGVEGERKATLTVALDVSDVATW
ncbi:hypothetical protein NFJ02_43g110860 [Pycnococcus provasolii]